MNARNEITTLGLRDLLIEFEIELDKARELIRTMKGFSILEKTFQKISAYNKETRSSDYWHSIDDPIAMLDGRYELIRHAGLKTKLYKVTIRSITVNEAKKAEVIRAKLVSQLGCTDDGTIFWQLAEKFSD